MIKYWRKQYLILKIPLLAHDIGRILAMHVAKRDLAKIWPWLILQDIIYIGLTCFAAARVIVIAIGDCTRHQNAHPTMTVKKLLKLNSRADKILHGIN